MFPKNPFVDGEFQRALTNWAGRIRMGFCKGCGVGITGGCGCL